MLDFQEKKSLRRVLYSKLTLLVLLVAVVFVGKGVYGLYGKYSDAREGYNVKASALTALERREGSLEESITDLKTERGLEQVVRETYLVAKPGEEVVVLVPADTASEAVVNSDKKAWWGSIVKWFK